MKKAKSNKKRGLIITCIVLAALIGGGTYMVQSTRARIAQAASSTSDEYKVTRGDMEVTAHGSGIIAFTQTDPVYAPLTAKVAKVEVKNGDVVRKGDTIAVLDGKDLDDEIEKLEDNVKSLDRELSATRASSGSSSIYAPVEGRIKAIYARKNDDVSMVVNQHGALCLLSTDGRMKLTFTSANPESLEVGAQVEVTAVRNDKERTEDGQITQISGDQVTVVIRDDHYDLGAEGTVWLDKKEIGKGALQINSPLPVIAQSGTISYVSRSVNSYVYAGNKLFSLKGEVLTAALSDKIDARADAQRDLDERRAKLDELTVVAPYDAVISDLSLVDGQMVQENALACRASAAGQYQLIVAVDELDIARVQLGQPASVKIDALPGERFAGTVSRISSLGTAGNGVTTFDVTVALSDAPGVLSSMTASVDIQTDRKEGALLAKLETVFTDGDDADQHYVWRIKPGEAKSGTQTNYERVNVTIGLTNDEYAEILSGVAEGDALTVPSNGAFGMQFMTGRNMRIAR